MHENDLYSNDVAYIADCEYLSQAPSSNLCLETKEKFENVQNCSMPTQNTSADRYFEVYLQGVPSEGSCNYASCQGQNPEGDFNLNRVNIGESQQNQENPFNYFHPSQLLRDESGEIFRAKYQCRKCRAHGQFYAVREHKKSCPFSDCSCESCNLVTRGRKIVARQISLYRSQRKVNQAAVRQGKNKNSEKKASQIKSVQNSNPHCRRCRNHGQTILWRGHKKSCPFLSCKCDYCSLITLRKENEKKIRSLNNIGSIGEYVDYLPKVEDGEKMDYPEYYIKPVIADKGCNETGIDSGVSMDSQSQTSLNNQHWHKQEVNETHESYIINCNPNVNEAISEMEDSSIYNYNQNYDNLSFDYNVNDSSFTFQHNPTSFYQLNTY